MHTKVEVRVAHLLGMHSIDVLVVVVLVVVVVVVLVSSK